MKKHNRFYKLLFTIENRKLNKLGVVMGFSMYPTSFGPGLKLGHYGNVVVHGHTRIGKNCEIQAGVVIGKTETSASSAPQIGSNVYIGAGAKVIGNIRIGNNVTIGANAVVNKDVPDNCVAVGIPAKVINTNATHKVRKGANLARRRPLPITWGDRLRMACGFDRDLLDWEIAER
jgi:serine O-acetyltransferase